MLVQNIRHLQFQRVTGQKFGGIFNLGNIFEKNALKIENGLMAKISFFIIPDTRNTQWFWEKYWVRIGYGQKLSGRVSGTRQSLVTVARNCNPHMTITQTSNLCRLEYSSDTSFTICVIGELIVIMFVCLFVRSGRFVSHSCVPIHPWRQKCDPSALTRELDYSSHFTKYSLAFTPELDYSPHFTKYLLAFTPKLDFSAHSTEYSLLFTSIHPAEDYGLGL